MKVSSVSSLSLWGIAFYTCAVQGQKSISNQKSIRRVLQEASTVRRMEQGYYDEEEEEEGILEVEDELMNYSLKLHNCFQDEALAYDDNGYPMMGVAIVRVCPSDSCSESVQGGCKSGYADLAVPLSTFVEAYLEDQAEYMQWDDAMDAESFSQCSQYQGNGNYYVGPACTSNGMDVRLGFFTDEACTNEASDGVFEELSNGGELPFASGGLISDQCVSCGVANGDDGALDLTDTCAELYEDAVYKCESWEISHYYWDAITEVFRFGQDTTGCKRIGWMDKTPEPFSEWASIFGLTFLVMVSVGGAYWYTEWWKEQKEGLERIDSNEDEEGEYHAHEDDEEDLTTDDESGGGANQGVFT